MTWLKPGWKCLHKELGSTNQWLKLSNKSLNFSDRIMVSKLMENLLPRKKEKCLECL